MYIAEEEPHDSLFERTPPAGQHCHDGAAYHSLVSSSLLPHAILTRHDYRKRDMRQPGFEEITAMLSII